MPARWMTTTAAACIATAAGAQGPLYRDVTATHLPAGLAGPCMDAAAGDADGDGDLDLALAMEFEPNILLLNDGAGVFANASDRLPRSRHDSEDVAFADFDADGDLDLVFVSEDDRKDELYLNDGAGRFEAASERLVPDDVSNALAVLDLNGDGAPDVLTGNIGTDRVLINDGRGRFRDETAERWPQSGESRTQDLELADVDADGDLDVLVGNEGQNELFLNEDGQLVDATARSLPARADETREIRAADVDGDDDLDLIVANVRFITDEPAQDYLLLNDGRGVFTTADLARLPGAGRSHFTIQVLDLDRDGDQDVLAPSTVFPSEGGRIGAGEGDWPNTSALEDVDLNDDGRLDIRVGDVAIGDGLAPASRSVPVADLDRDGDLIMPSLRTMDGPGDYLALLNDGSGRFAAAAPGTILPMTAAVGNGFDVEVADFDRDGIADLFLCNRASISMPAAAASSGGQQRLLLGAGRD